MPLFKNKNVKAKSLEIRTKSVGNHYEKQALYFLKRQGLALIEKNFSSRFGEIDLIMKDNETICFIEVRYRSKTTHGGSISSITPKKQQRIRHTAALYLQKKIYLQKSPCRFDVLAISRKNDTNDIKWIKSAFY